MKACNSLLDSVDVGDGVDDTEEEIDERVDVVGNTLNHEEGPTVLVGFLLFVIIRKEYFPRGRTGAVRALVFPQHFQFPFKTLIGEAGCGLY